MSAVFENEIIANAGGKLNDILLSLNKPKADFSESPLGVLHLFGKDHVIEVKKNVTMQTMAKKACQIRQAQAILFAEYISPQMCEWLVREGIEYIDTAGNMFIKDGESTIWVKNCARPQNMESDSAKGRAWTPTGLKVLFLLLTEEDAINWPYRKIAEYSGVSLGSVRYIMADLKNQRTVIELNNQNIWIDKNQVYENWARNYQGKLLPALRIKKYQGNIPENIAIYPLHLSGETVAYRLHILKSHKLLAYANRNINECISRNRWQESNDGNIEVREVFWPVIRGFGTQVPYLLVYADLLGENDSRCTEAALEIYHRYLEA